MNLRLKQIYTDLDRFIKNYPPNCQNKYIRLRKNDYNLMVKSLPHYEKIRADKKGYFEYRDFTVILEK